MRTLKKYRIYYPHYGDTETVKSRTVHCHRIDVDNDENSRCVLRCVVEADDPALNSEVAAFANWNYYLEVKT